MIVLKPKIVLLQQLLLKIDNFTLTVIMGARWKNTACIELGNTLSASHLPKKKTVFIIKEKSSPGFSVDLGPRSESRYIFYFMTLQIQVLVRRISNITIDLHWYHNSKGEKNPTNLSSFKNPDLSVRFPCAQQPDAIHFIIIKHPVLGIAYNQAQAPCVRPWLIYDFFSSSYSSSPTSTQTCCAVLAWHVDSCSETEPYRCWEHSSRHPTVNLYYRGQLQCCLLETTGRFGVSFSCSS